MLPTITTTDPIVIPAQSEKIYDKLWLTSLHAQFESPSSGGFVLLQLRHYNINEQQEIEFAPSSIPLVQVPISNVFESASKNTKHGLAMITIIEAIQEFINQPKDAEGQ